MLQREIPNTSIKMATVQQKARLWFPRKQINCKSQRCFRLEYRKCQFPRKNSIKRWYEQYLKATGNAHYRKGAGRPSASDEVLERVRESLTSSYQLFILTAHTNA
ncbi:hypothetical protein AVEN_242623-1 [Araneus ventricosus]|uniref:DUF4817 domain-containing protein n=1 Tax=Araneus ventricosus TaxID=182803 RepID=A0A4Y2VNJ2_ARAVE|nr:hypothetical protein AVEN_242623-1 [Araneus ventricosus]